ncbi:hypothetical protein L2D08_01830 [Domibacillus sp. PGB-M46]|uniref:hypothetical protein n=1 Tax=Domibacillus sp. PGB-M46 TaxID=2910255 RepID=UPI001F5A3AB2|nr:hypothetical protein [Domibacillus sp. PGB-M46]MCI2253099.1 hypothetical protein [Domibacillus sp. PGB-M46]
MKKNGSVRNIVNVVYRTSGRTVFLDKSARAGSVYTYGVTALSATGVEKSKEAFVVKEENNLDEVHPNC